MHEQQVDCGLCGVKIRGFVFFGHKYFEVVFLHDAVQCPSSCVHFSFVVLIPFGVVCIEVASNDDVCDVFVVQFCEDSV